MRAAERRRFAREILAAHKESHAADMRQLALLEQYSEEACPLRPGDIVVKTDLGRRSFFMVQKLDSRMTLGMKVPEWIVRAYRCTREGDRRPGHHYFRESEFSSDMIFKKGNSHG